MALKILLYHPCFHICNSCQLDGTPELSNQLRAFLFVPVASTIWSEIAEEMLKKSPKEGDFFLGMDVRSAVDDVSGVSLFKSFRRFHDGEKTRIILVLIALCVAVPQPGRYCTTAMC
jgi:hypothetical protein